MPPRPRECRFEILPPGEHAANGAWAEMHRSAKTRRRSVSRKLEHKAKEEAKLNDDEVTRARGQVVTYGATYELRHVNSGKLLTLSTQLGPEVGTIAVELMHQSRVGSNAYVRLLPAFNSHATGSEIHDGHAIRIEYAQRELFLSIAPVNGAAPDHKHVATKFISCISTEATRFEVIRTRCLSSTLSILQGHRSRSIVERISRTETSLDGSLSQDDVWHKLSNAEDRAEHQHRARLQNERTKRINNIGMSDVYLHGCDVVRLVFNETGKEMRCEPDPETGKWLPVFETPARNYTTNSLSMWIIVPEDLTGCSNLALGGSESRYRFQHLVTGLYLSCDDSNDMSELVAVDNYLTDKSAIETLFSCTLMSEIDAAIAHPGLLPDRETYFITHVTSECEIGVGCLNTSTVESLESTNPSIGRNSNAMSHKSHCLRPLDTTSVRKQNVPDQTSGKLVENNKKSNSEAFIADNKKCRRLAKQWKRSSIPLKQHPGNNFGQGRSGNLRLAASYANTFTIHRVSEDDVALVIWTRNNREKIANFLERLAELCQRHQIDGCPFEQSQEISLTAALPKPMTPLGTREKDGLDFNVSPNESPLEGVVDFNRRESVESLSSKDTAETDAMSYGHEKAPISSANRKIVIGESISTMDSTSYLKMLGVSNDCDTSNTTSACTNALLRLAILHGKSLQDALACLLSQVNRHPDDDTPKNGLVERHLLRKGREAAPSFMATKGAADAVARVQALMLEQHIILQILTILDVFRKLGCTQHNTLKDTRFENIRLIAATSIMLLRDVSAGNRAVIDHIIAHIRTLMYWIPTQQHVETVFTVLFRDNRRVLHAVDHALIQFLLDAIWSHGHNYEILLLLTTLCSCDEVPLTWNQNLIASFVLSERALLYLFYRTKWDKTEDVLYVQDPRPKLSERKTAFSLWRSRGTLSFDDTSLEKESNNGCGSKDHVRASLSDGESSKWVEICESQTNEESPELNYMCCTLKLLASLCAGRNSFAFKKLLQKSTSERLFVDVGNLVRIIQSPRVPSRLREAACALFDLLYLDREPREITKLPRMTRVSALVDLCPTEMRQILRFQFKTVDPFRDFPHVHQINYDDFYFKMLKLLKVAVVPWSRICLPNNADAGEPSSESNATCGPSIHTNKRSRFLIPRHRTSLPGVTTKALTKTCATNSHLNLSNSDAECHVKATRSSAFRSNKIMASPSQPMFKRRSLESSAQETPHKTNDQTLQQPIVLADTEFDKQAAGHIPHYGFAVQLLSIVEKILRFRLLKSADESSSSVLEPLLMLIIDILDSTRIHDEDNYAADEIEVPPKISTRFILSSEKRCLEQKSHDRLILHNKALSMISLLLDIQLDQRISIFQHAVEREMTDIGQPGTHYSSEFSDRHSLGVLYSRMFRESIVAETLIADSEDAECHLCLSRLLLTFSASPNAEVRCHAMMVLLWQLTQREVCLSYLGSVHFVAAKPIAIVYHEVNQGASELRRLKKWISAANEGYTEALKTANDIIQGVTHFIQHGTGECSALEALGIVAESNFVDHVANILREPLDVAESPQVGNKAEEIISSKKGSAASEATYMAIDLPAARCHDHLIVLRSIVEFAVAYCQGGTSYKEEIFVHIRLFMSHMGVKHLDMARAIGAVLQNNKRLLNTVSDDLIRHIVYLTKHLGRRSRWLKLISELLVCNGKVVALNQKTTLNKLSENVDLLNLDGSHGNIPLYFLILQREHFFRYNSTLQYHRVSLQVLGLCATDAIECQLVVHSVMPFTKAVKGYVDCGMPKQNLPPNSHEPKMAVRLEECPKHQISALSIKLSWLQLLTAAYLTCELESLANLVAAYAFPEHFKNQIAPMLDSELGDSYPTMSIFDALVFDVECCIGWRDGLQAVETDEASSDSKFNALTNAGGERKVPQEWRTGRLIVDYICKGVVPAVLALFTNAYLQATAREVLTSDIKARLFDALTRFITEACPAEEMTAPEFSQIKQLPLSLHGPLDKDGPAPLPVCDIRQKAANQFGPGGHLSFAYEETNPQMIQNLGMRHWQYCVSNMASFARATNLAKHSGRGTVAAAHFLLSTYGRCHLRYIVVSLRLIAAHLRERRLGIPFPSSIEGLVETDFDTSASSLEIACRYAERTHFVDMMLNVFRITIHVRAGATIGDILNGVPLEASSPAATEAVLEAISQWQLHTVAIGFLGLTGHEGAAVKLLMTLALRGECAQRALQDAIIIHTRSEEARCVGASLGIMLLRDCDAICARQAQRNLLAASPDTGSRAPKGTGPQSSGLLLDSSTLNRSGLRCFTSRVASFIMSVMRWSSSKVSKTAKLCKMLCFYYSGNIYRICPADWSLGGRCFSRVHHNASGRDVQSGKPSRIHVEQESEDIPRNHRAGSETYDPQWPKSRRIVQADIGIADTLDTLALVEFFKMLCKHGHEGMQNLMGTPIQLNKKVAFPVEHQRTTIVALAVEWFVTLVREPDGSTDVVRLRKIVGILEVIYMLIISNPANTRIVTCSNFLPRVSRLLQAALPKSTLFDQHSGLSTAPGQRSAYEYSSHMLRNSDFSTEIGSQATTEATENNSMEDETNERRNVATFSSRGGTRIAAKRRLSMATLGPTQYSRQKRQLSMRGALPRVQHDLRAVILRIILVMLRGRDGATLVPMIRQCVTESMLAVVMHTALTKKLSKADLLEEGFLACFIKSTLDLHDELNAEATSPPTCKLSVADKSVDGWGMAEVLLPNPVVGTPYVGELKDSSRTADMQLLALQLSSKSMDIREMMQMYHLEAGVVDIARNGKVERMLFRKHERVIDLESDLRWQRRTLERLRSIPRGEKVDSSVKARAFLDEINKIAREEVALSHTRTAFVNSMSCLFERLPNFVSVLLNAMILLNYQKRHFHELYDAWVTDENTEASSSLNTPTNSTETYSNDDELDDGMRFRLGSVFERSVVLLGIAYNIIAGIRIIFRIYARFALVVMDCRPHLETLIMLPQGQMLWRSAFEKVYAGLKLLKVIIDLLFVPALCIWSSLLGNLVSPAWHACHLLEWSISNRKIQFISQTFINSMSLVVFLLGFSFNCLYITYALIFEHFKYQRIRCASTWQCWYSAAILNTLGNPSSLFWNVDPLLAETPQPFGNSIDAAWVLLNVVVYFLFSFLIQTLIGTIFFNELSKLTNQEEEMKKDLLNCCLVCSMNRHQFAHKQNGWEKHVEIDHNPMNYVALALTLGFRQHEVHKFTAYEAYVYQKLLEDDASLLPSNVCYKKPNLYQ